MQGDDRITKYRVKMYEAGRITAYQLMIDCLYMIDPEQPEMVLDGLPSEIHDKILEYSSRYDPSKVSTKKMPTSNQVKKAVDFIWINYKNVSAETKVI